MYKKILRIFSELGMKFIPGYLAPLREVLGQSGMKTVFDLYIGRMLFFAATGFIVSFFWVLTFFSILGFDILFSLAGGIIFSLLVASFILTVFHTYPYHLVSNKKRSIEANLPFAANHMGAIAASGIAPHIMFRMLTDVKEYGEVGKEAMTIVRNTDSFGMDINSAIKDVADRTPSQQFRQFLYGIISTISSGGDLRRYLQNYAKESLTDYRLKREKYISALSLYADFYTAVLIAAPLFFISIMAVMSMIGGTLMGMPIHIAIQIGIYILIPMLNIFFLLFIHFTQPAV